VATDGNPQVPVFLERIRGLFSPSPDGQRPEEPHRGAAVSVCVLLSLVLWFSLTLQERRTVTLELPVEPPRLPEETAFVERPASTVSAELEGTGMELIRFLFDPPTVQIEGDAGQIDVQEAIALPRGSNTRIENVVPRTIEIETGPRVERRIPIRSRIDVIPASAHELIDAPTLRPDSVSIIGAESVVEGLQWWPTQSRTVQDLRDTVRTEVPLADTLGRLVTRSVDAVTLVARVGKFTEASQEVNVDVTGVPSDQDLVALQPSTIRIRYRILFDQFFRAQKRSSEFFATVSYSQIRSDTTGYVEPHIHVPSDLLIRDPEPVPPRLRYYTSLSE